MFESPFEGGTGEADAKRLGKGVIERIAPSPHHEETGQRDDEGDDLHGRMIPSIRLVFKPLHR